MLVLLRKLWLLLLFGFVCAILAGLISKYVIAPVYTSSTKIYLIHRQNEDATTYSDLQTSSQFINDYKILILSRPVLEEVIREVSLDITQKELISFVSIRSPAETRILEISVEHSEPVTAKKLVDSLASVSAKQMISIMEIEKVNIVEPGDIPTEASGPNVILNIILGGLIGIGISAVIIIIRYLMDDTIKNGDDIENHFEMINLGSIPFNSNKKSLNGYKNRKGNRTKASKEKKKRKKNIKGSEKTDNFVSSEDTEKNIIDYYIDEAYKSLRTNIQFCGKEIKTICVTSCIPNEGKTVTAFRLAVSLAESGMKVLFIDADLRKSVILRRLKLDHNIHGLSQYLSGLSDLEDVINKTIFKNVSIIFSGPIPPNPSELLGNEIFHELIESQKEVYDYIIIDTPPLGVVVDSANVAKICDGTLIVVEANNVSYKAIRKVLKQLELGKCKVLGTVLNKVRMNSNKYYVDYY